MRVTGHIATFNLVLSHATPLQDYPNNRPTSLLPLPCLAEKVGRDYVLRVFCWFKEGRLFPGCLLIWVELAHTYPLQISVQRLGFRLVSKCSWLGLRRLSTGANFLSHLDKM